MKHFKPVFPTTLHRQAAETVCAYFQKVSYTDTVLVVNSCARGQAAPESDLDMAILVKEETPAAEMEQMHTNWLRFTSGNATLQAYKKSSPFAHLHIDIISGSYTPGNIEPGEPIDYFEVETGNQICYAAPIGSGGAYFKQLRKNWLSYYAEDLRIERLKGIRAACLYDLDHIPYFIRRELYFQAFDILYKAFQEYLQALFIANKTYPIAYNKWIKYQVADILKKPDLYPLLSPVLSIKNVEGNEINEKAKMLRQLLAGLANE